MSHHRPVARRGRNASISATAAFETTPRAGTPGLDRVHREVILARRSATLTRLNQLAAAAAELAGEAQPLDAPNEEDMGEASGAIVDRDRLLALASAARVSLAEIDAALARIEAGAYGVCAGCSQPIPEARLEAVPEATHCVGCKTGGLRFRT